MADQAACKSKRSVELEDCMGGVLSKRLSSSLLGKLAPPCLCCKHIPSYVVATQ